MKSAGRSRRLSVLSAVLVAATIAILAFAFLATGYQLQSALGAPVTETTLPGSISGLSVSTDRPLSRLGDSTAVFVEGAPGASLVGTKLVVRIKGPAEVGQLRQDAPELPEVGKLVALLGEDASRTTTTASPGPPSSTTLGSSQPVSTTTTLDIQTNPSGELTQGVIQARVVLPGQLLSRPGAYLLVAEIKRSGQVLARGQTWVGKVQTGEQPVQVACLWPVFMGIHRDADGVFYDQELEEAVASAAAGEGSLAALLSLPQNMSDWHFTVALEPVLLSQLRDMADGFKRRSPSGEVEAVQEDAAAAENASRVLEQLRTLAASPTVEIAAVAYANPDLNALAAQGWRDGFEQIQLGKAEVQETLALSESPQTGYSPDLVPSADSLSYFAQASVDHVVVDSSVAGLLTESVPAGTVAVRTRDVDNDRVTLVFADGALGSLLVGPWDIGVFCAGLAWALASGEKQALVVTPRSADCLPPADYLVGIGRALSGLDWLETVTVSSLLRSHPPESRPMMLKSLAPADAGYIETVLLGAVASAHAAVGDLGTLADATRAPIEAAHKLLYLAESRWWARAGTSPKEASAGLEFAERAASAAKEELSKVRLDGARSTVVVGREGNVILMIDNSAAYPVTARLRLVGSGLAVLGETSSSTTVGDLTGGEPSGREESTVAVALTPGVNEVPVAVRETGDPHHLDVTLLAGETVLGQGSYRVRFVTFTNLLPWVVLAAFVLIGAGVALTRWRVASRRGHQRASIGT